MYSFPPGLRVEISDGECGHRGLGAWGGRLQRGQELSRGVFNDEWPNIYFAEEAVFSPKTSNAPRRGAGGALQCGAGEWLRYTPLVLMKTNQIVKSAAETQGIMQVLVINKLTKRQKQDTT